MISFLLCLLVAVQAARTVRYKIVRRRRKKRGSGKVSTNTNHTNFRNIKKSSNSHPVTASSLMSESRPFLASYAARVVVCAVMRDEDRYVDEWILYNKYLGFDAIHIYDNSWGGSAKLAYLPQRYGSFVTVKHFPGEGLQNKAYSQCVKRYNRPNTWAAFIDADEFIVLRKHITIQELLNAVIPNGGALSLNRITFGSSGHLQYDPDVPVLRRFIARSNVTDIFVKTIAHLPDVARVEPHYVTLKGSNTRVDCHGHVMTTGSINREASEDIAAVHHYFTKSYEEFRLKRLRGDAYSKIRAQRYHRPDSSLQHSVNATDAAALVMHHPNITCTSGELCTPHDTRDNLTTRAKEVNNADSKVSAHTELLILQEFQAWDRDANMLYDSRALEFYTRGKIAIPNFPRADMEGYS
jgi:hypothetical protein